MVRPHQLRSNQSRRYQPDQCVATTDESCHAKDSCLDSPTQGSPQRRCVESDVCRQDEAGCLNFTKRYLALLDAPQSALQWKEIWKLFVSHPWINSRLDRCARSALRGSYLSDQWLDDVKQEVLVRLASKLQRIPDLRLDRSKVETHFAGWMHTILLRDCRAAVRTIRRLHCRTFPLRADSSGSDPTTSLDARLDFNLALKELDDAESSVVLLYAQGYTIREIASALGYSNSKAYRLVRRAVSRIERQLLKGSATMASRANP